MIKKILVFFDNLLYKGILKGLMKTSKLGHGFIVSGAESGTNFEHLYNNKSQGKFLIGKFVDRVLLNLPAVKATRQRKEDVKTILWNEIENFLFKGKPIRIIDLASGGARYIRELIKDYPNYPIEAFCIDRDERCVALGHSLLGKENLAAKKIRFVRGDIFKLKHARKFANHFNWKPNIVIASGLFIYFNDQLVTKTLREIFDALEFGGSVIFSSYESLNTRKLMRKTMSTSSGDAWTLYYRKPEYWRSVLSEIGFKDVFITRDKWKMNNVCVARK